MPTFVCQFLTPCLSGFLLCGLCFAQEADSSTWDITAPFGPTESVRFSTDEGTWLNIDVSPDGRDLVFDMLGDIYTLPITGGKATAITSGPAWDAQPRYSPDGSRIAFTSDRDGGDNIWTMDRNGSDSTQITDEDFRLVNGPEWTPDGQYILARKHFTSTRSLGAGEVWMYHASGQATAGIQLTKQNNDQQDQGNEIAVSPDGRYVYFSEDGTPGSTFQYNKDPNRQIYIIRRLDRETGELIDLITGAGGAARPRPSPDGRHVAFVRRVRAKSVLYLYDIETGGQRPLYDGLDHDQQEAWAIFGVYPSYAWTPDGKSIVFWSGGKIRRIDLATKQVTPIPFEADVDLTITEALHFDQPADGRTFDAKMIRDAVTSPDGSTLVFHAVGHLWKKQLPDGTPSRLTSSSHFEYEPAFSPDGRTVVYTTWSDEEFAAIYAIPLGGGIPKKLTTRPGYYFTPRFSRDGARLVYRRGSGNRQIGYLHGVNTGIYWMPAGGGEATLIRKEGREPRFDATGQRVYFLTGGGLEKEYKSVRLDGGDERTHFDLKYANNVIPSPDGKWIVFTELFNAYVAPLPETGGAIALNKDTKAIPVKKVTRDAGTDLHWSDDSKALHWMIGPEYFSREVSDSFSFVDGAPEELPAIDTTGVPVGLTIETDIPLGTVAFTGARVVTMRGDEVLDGATVVVDGNRIVAVGSDGGVRIPGGAHLIDATGKTIIPGFVDAHAHAGHFYSGPSAQQYWSYYANLAYGTTTAHDPSANTEFVFSQSELVKAGKIVGPRVYSTGTILYGADGDFKAVVNNLEDARSHIRRLKAVGAFSVKSYNQPRRNQRQQVLKAAREYEMLVMPEGGSTFYHNMTQVADGHTGIEHVVPVAPFYRDVVQFWGATDVGYTPTLVVGYGALSGEYYWYEKTDVWDKERLLRFVPRSIVDPRSRRRLKTPDEEYFHITLAESVKMISDAGNTVQIGPHGQLQGLAAHWEIWMFVQGGMSPHQALRSATLDGAKYIGMDRHLGSIESGKLADLLVIDGNPLDDIYETENIEMVMINGRLFDAETMNQIGNHPDERRPFYWERDEVSDAFLWDGALGVEGAVCSCGAGMAH